VAQNQTFDKIQDGSCRHLENTQAGLAQFLTCSRQIWSAASHWPYEGY